ncbi:putative iron transport multicopper oxidase [Ceraceosorus guamensis]|uniref:Putative iron transport multicopper oxidase n=1 Tax=Ceraceosorus guamensis TaxID=1522189 RepID=A0A316W5N0_9BASI|nr:putative iron transport multicopper oxidase [Ceraceosorus guamensis]PWN45159.1 putative iron transport multicopper oxidase [Ceraceosorus guamensis]
MRASSSAIVAGAAALVAASSSTLAANVDHVWNVGWVNDVNPDGLQPRRAIGVNGTWPPPIINVNSTDVLRVTVNNAFDDGTGTALHSHGMFFNNTGYWDGAVGITQCPIPAGQSITYEPLNSPSGSAGRKEQWGTFWTHGHYAGQYVDGLRTPAIIHNANEVHAYDDDYTIILADWYHDEHDYLLKNEFINVKNPTGAEPVPKAAQVYFAHTSNATSASYLAGFNENATLPFVPGKTYRLRLINMSALSMYHFWIEGHDMRIIEADGVDTEESPVDVITISVAQRYSILITARSDTSKNWPIHANLDPDMYDVVPDDLQLNVTATLSYASGQELGSERPTLDEYKYFDDTVLVPSAVEGMSKADASHDLHVSFNTYSDGKPYASFNNISFINPNTPSLSTLTSMGSLSADAAVYGPNTGATIFNHMDMVQVTIYNWDAGTHPFHLHGHNFQVVHKAIDVTSDDPALNPPFNETQVNPMRRDTITIHSTGSATIRFRADNPGAWFLHCHIEWHMNQGLSTLLLEAPLQAQQTLSTPAVFGQQCQSQGISPTGNAAGFNSTTDFEGLQAEPTYLVTGWTPKAVGALTGCIITALCGIAAVVAYGYTEQESSDEQQEEEDK